MHPSRGSCRFCFRRISRRDVGDRSLYFAEDMYDVTTETRLTVVAARYRVSSNASCLSYGEAIDLLRIDGDFRSFLTEQ